MRLDDDIVYIENGFFARFLARAEAERGKAFWFSPIVINNAICAWMLKHFAALRLEGPISAQAMCPYAWASANLPIALHPVFIHAVRKGRLGDFRTPDREVRLARFSINAVGFFGSDAAALGEGFIAPEGNEEEWLSAVLPAKLNRPGKLFGDLTVAHFSFYTQERSLLMTDLLDAYYDLAGLPRLAYEKPVAKKKRLKDRLRPWRHKHVDPGPIYSCSLSGAG